MVCWPRLSSPAKKVLRKWASRCSGSPPRPFVVAWDIDKRVCRSVELREPASHHAVRTGICSGRQVAHVNHEHQGVPVEVVEYVLQQRLLGRAIAEIADQAECDCWRLA